MAVITGKEAMFVDIKLSKAAIDLINLSPTLVDQLLKYNRDVGSGAVTAMEVDPNGSGSAKVSLVAGEVEADGNRLIGVQGVRIPPGNA